VRTVDKESAETVAAAEFNVKDHERARLIEEVGFQRR